MRELLKKVGQELGNFFGDVKGDPKEQMLLVIEDEMEKQAKRLAKRGNSIDPDNLMRDVMTKTYFIKRCAECSIATIEVREIAKRVANDHQRPK